MPRNFPPHWFVDSHLQLLMQGPTVAGGRGLLTLAFTELLERNSCILDRAGIQASLDSLILKGVGAQVFETADWPG